MRVEYKTVPLKRNGTGFLIGQYVYLRDGTDANNSAFQYIRCQKYKKCPARGVIVGASAIDCLDEHHNHPPPDVLAMLFRKYAIQMASDPANMSLTSKGVYNKTVSAFLKDNQALKQGLPSYKDVLWAIKSNRIKQVGGWKVYSSNKKAGGKQKTSKSCEQLMEATTSTVSTKSVDTIPSLQMVHTQPDISTSSVQSPVDTMTGLLMHNRVIMPGIPMHPERANHTTDMDDQKYPKLIQDASPLHDNQKYFQDGSPTEVERKFMKPIQDASHTQKYLKLIQDAKELELVTGCKISLEILPSDQHGQQLGYKSEDFPPK